MDRRHNIAEIVDEVIQSPSFRDGLRTTIESILPATSSSPSINVTAIESAVPQNSIRQEIQRLFRPHQANSMSFSASTTSNVIPRRKHKRDKPSGSGEFIREIILLTDSTATRTLTGKTKRDAFVHKFGISGVKFQKCWNDEQILSFIRNLFIEKLPASISIEILIPMSGRLIKPNLPPGDVLNGYLLNHVSTQKTIYVRPSSTLANNETNSSGEEELSDSFFQNLAASSYDEELIEGFSRHSQHEQTNTFIEEPTTLTTILSSLKEKINRDAITTVNVNRDTIFDCMLRTVRRKSFSPWNQINVIFTDINNKTEGALDTGGPSREFWRLLLQHIKNSHLFEGPEESKNLSLNNDALEDKLYFEAGRIISLSIVHGGSGPYFLSANLYDMLTKCLTDIIPDEKEIYDADIASQIQRVSAASNLEELQEAIDTCPYLTIAGCSPFVSNFEKKNSILRNAIDFYVLYRNRPALDQFISGLMTCGVYNLIKSNIEIFAEIMCTNNTLVLNALQIDHLFQINFSEVGSNNRTSENKLIGYWRDYLQDCQEGESEVSLKEILIFTTGADSVPPLGFDHEISVEFLHGDTCPYPKANTCSLEIFLPTIHDNFDNFKKFMDFGIKNGQVFGYV